MRHAKRHPRDGQLETRLTRKQILAHIEKEAQRRFGLSADELIEKYKNGELHHPGDVADLLGLASLFPENDRLFVPS